MSYLDKYLQKTEKGKRVTIIVQVEPELHSKVKDLLSESGLTWNEWVRGMMMAYLDSKKKTE